MQTDSKTPRCYHCYYCEYSFDDEFFYCEQHKLRNMLNIFGLKEIDANKKACKKALIPRDWDQSIIREDIKKICNYNKKEVLISDFNNYGKCPCLNCTSDNCTSCDVKQKVLDKMQRQNYEWASICDMCLLGLKK